MLINPQTNHFHQWKQKQSLLDQLLDIADLPITSLSVKRDELQQRFSNFIFEQDIDSLSAGMLFQSHLQQTASTQKYFYKPATTNIYLAELFIAADQVLYHGSFSFVGKQIIAYLIEQISNSKNKLLESNRYTDLKNSDGFFNHSELKELLKDKELQLLLALTSPASAEEIDNEGILISYNRPLKEAAANIEMHFKEAQIIEFNLLNELKNNKNTKSILVRPIENCFEVNCDFLVLLGKSLSNDYEQENAELAIKIFHGLCQKYYDESPNKSNLVNLIYAGIMLLQAEYKLDLVDTLEELTLQLAKQSKTTEPNEKLEYQETVISLFQQRNNSKSDTAKNQLVFLSKQQIDLDSRLMELKARFNPYRLIFVV